MIPVLLQTFIIMSCRTDLCQMISVFLQVLINSTKHIDKSVGYKFAVPWLGTGLITSTGESCQQRSTKMCDK